MPGYFFRLLCLLFTVMLTAYAHCSWAQAGDTVSVKQKKPREELGHQLRFSIDIARPIASLIRKDYRSYEAMADYYYRNEVYLVAEGGFGSAVYDYPDLSYKSNNSFFRIGVDRTLIRRLGPGDWDAAFIGARYAAGFINRGGASYTIADSVWGISSGSIPGKSFTAHWAELVGGVRVELLKNVFAGWNVRGRFLLNQRSFRELAPAFIAGYGRGDKTTVFDFNFYLCYAIRWRSREAAGR